MYRLFHAYGINLGRDSDDQALGGEFVAREDLQKGDLILLPKPRGARSPMWPYIGGITRSWMPITHRGVAIRSLPERLQYDYWITARRYLP